MFARRWTKRLQASKRAIFWSVGCALLGAFLAYAPVSHERILREGTDVYGAHHALWGKRVKSITQTALSPVRGVGLILVNLRQSDAPLSVQVAASVAGQEVAHIERVLPVFADDEFVWFDFGSAVIQGGETYTISVSAIGALEEAPVGVRFNQLDKQLALSVRERLPVWEYADRWITDNEARARRGFFMVFGGMAAAAILFAFELLDRRVKGAGLLLGLLALVFLVIYLRAPLALGVDSAYGGDAFNYFLKSRAWIAGEDPFAADFRKAPLYSFLIMPGLLPALDPVMWARGISILAATGAVILVSFFLLRLGLSLSFALGAGALLSINRDFQFESVQGLANTLYTACIVAAAYLFAVKKTYLLHIVSALATLVRYEGTAVAAVLIPASWIVYKMKWWSIVRNIIPVIILLAMPFLFAPFTGSAGVRTISDIQSDEGLYLGSTWETFAPSLTAFRLFIGRLWILREHIGNPFIFFGYGMVIGGFGSWFFKKYGYPRYMISMFGVLAVVALVFDVLFGVGDGKFFIASLAGIAGIGAGAALWSHPRIAIPILLMLFVQAMAVTAILPKTRYYLPLIPFIAAAIAGGFFVISGAQISNRGSRILALFALCMAGTFAYADSKEHLSGQLSDYNEKSAGQTVLLEAARYLRFEEGVVVAAEGSDLQFRVYAPQERLLTMPDSLRDVHEQLAMMEGSGAEYVVNTTENPYFTKLVGAFPDRFEVLETFMTKWTDTTATIYRIY